MLVVLLVGGGAAGGAAGGAGVAAAAGAAEAGVAAGVGAGGVMVVMVVVMVVVSCLSLARETNKDQPAMVNYLHSTLYNKSIVLHSIYTCMPPGFFFKENLSPWIQYLTSGSAMKVPIISMAPLEGGSINLTWKKNV